MQDKVNWTKPSTRLKTIIKQAIMHYKHCLLPWNITPVHLLPNRLLTAILGLEQSACHDVFNPFHLLLPIVCPMRPISTFQNEEKM